MMPVTNAHAATQMVSTSAVAWPEQGNQSGSERKQGKKEVSRHRAGAVTAERVHPAGC